LTKQDLSSTISWTLLSVVLNGLFFGHGVLVVSSSGGLALVGLSAIVYALAGLSLLGAAWLTPFPAIAVMTRLLSVVYAVFLLTLAWQLDVLRGFEGLAGIVILLAVVAANQLAVKRVLTR